MLKDLITKIDALAESIFTFQGEWKKFSEGYRRRQHSIDERLAAVPDLKTEWNDFLERNHYRQFQIDQHLASLEKRLKQLEDDADFDRFLESIEVIDDRN